MASSLSNRRFNLSHLLLETLNVLVMQKVTFRLLSFLAIFFALVFIGGCSTHPPLPTPDHVELERFMGRWYVLGYTPILVDKKAHNAIEHYRLDEENKIQTTYQFRDGGFDGELKTYTPVGWVHDKSTNAQWRMQFIWPFRSDYIILHLAEDYSRTIVVHPSRKYAWIMQREPQISDQDYETMLQILESEGVDRGLLLRLPQDWSTEAERMDSLRSAGL